MAAEPEDVPAAPSDEPTATSPAQAATEPAAGAKPAEAEAAEEIPEPTPETCTGIAISQQAFEEAVLNAEFEGTEFLFYLEPAGVLGAELVCARRYPAESLPAGILMTKAARVAKTVFFDDGINPDKYELSFPKEFGYVKSIQHYQPASREHANYPWSKRY